MPAFSVKKPLTIFVATLAVIVLGVVAYLKMTPDLLPNMDFPYVIVVTTDPGASPESIEEEISKPLEKAMAGLNGIKSVTSSSQNSVSMVMLEFEEGVNMDTVGVDVQQSISTVQGAWDDMVSAPYVLKINPSVLPVMVAAVSSDDMDIKELSDFLDETLEDKLTGISGVASVDASGTVKRQAHVILSQAKMEILADKIEKVINEQLDDAAKELYKARKEVTDAQKAIDEAEYSAIHGIITGVTGPIQTGIDTLQKQGKELEKKFDTVYDLSEDYVNNLGRLVEIDGEMLAKAGDEEAMAALQAERESLLASQTDIEIALAAYGTSPEDAEKDLDDMKKSMDDVQLKITTAMKDLKSGKTTRKVAGDATDIIVGAIDAVGQITEGRIQLNNALSQIDAGLDVIAESRKDLGEQADLSGKLNITAIQQLLVAQNFAMPAGYIDDNEGVSYMVNVGDNVSSQEELKNLVLIDLHMEGLEPIRLGDVADVMVTDNSGEIYTKLNGQDDVIVTFNKQSNYATADVSERIFARFDTLEEEYPGLHFVPLMDQGDYINLITDSIMSSLLWGALFSVIVLFFFLRDWRPTLITLVAIPVSMVFAVVLMYFTGVTINMISLSGLAVSVGMLVDNSVVVIENIYRLRSKGATVIQAAVSGAGQVLGAITASTLTTVCVFLPIVFVEGITRTLFTDLALTMTYSLMASLIVAITLVPAMAQGLLRKAYEPKQGILDKIYPAYRKAIEWSLSHKALVFLLALVLLVSSAAGTIVRGFVFMPEMDMNMISASITIPEEATREEAVELADEVCRRAMTVENVSAVGAMMGGGSSVMGGGGGAYDVTVYITMPEGTSGAAAGKEIEELCGDMDCEVNCDGINAMTSMMTGGSGISLTVYGEDMENLQEAARTIGKRIEAVEGTTEVSDGLEDAAPAIHITVDRVKAMEHGMTVAQVYMQIAEKLTNNVTGAEMNLDQQKMEVIIESIEERRVALEDLEQMTLTADTSMASAMAGASMGSSDMSAMMAMMGGEEEETEEEEDDGTFTLGEIAAVEKTVSLNSISRVGQRRCITVSAGIEGGYNVTLVSAEAEKALGSLTLPEGTSYSFGGENEAIMEALRQLVLMTLLGIVLVYFIMVAQFQSLKSPFIVMFTIPLAFTGGFLGLLISGF